MHDKDRRTREQKSAYIIGFSEESSEGFPVFTSLCSALLLGYSSLLRINTLQFSYSLFKQSQSIKLVQRFIPWISTHLFLEL